MEVATAVAVVTSAATAYFTIKNNDTQKKQIKAEQAANQRQYELDVMQRQLALAEEQRKNRNLLAQQQSTYRAKLGASGLSSKSGSGRTVLDSMKKEYDAEDKYLVNQANVSLEALLNGINSRNTRNLLSASQLKAQSVANAASALNSFTSTAGRSMIK